jgi:hypothetical protein
MFWFVLLAGIALVIVQGILSYFDGYLTQAQMQAHGVTNGYSFMEHGGMWADVFVISPMVAYLTTKYRFGYTAWWSWLILGIALAITIGSAPIYNKIGLMFPVAHSHDGHTTAAGYIHGVFAVAVLWIAGMFYFTPTDPPASAHDLIGISALLTPFFFLGIVDFNSRWIFLKGAKIQLAVSILILWIMTGIRLAFR